MKTEHLIFVAVVAAGAMTLRAQTPDYPAPSPPVNAGISAYSYGDNGGYQRNVTLAGAVTFPYATNWDSAGISGELGALWRSGHFIGGELSYYSGDNSRYDVFDSTGAFAGHFYSRQEVTTLDFAYRYTAPLWTVDSHPLLSLYVGASGGIGFVNYDNNGAAFGFHNDNSARPTGEVLAGLQYNPSPNLSVRVGYRYLEVNDAWRFVQHVNLDTNVVEAGIAFRF